MRWADLYIDGKRLDRIIRILEKKIKKATDDEKIIKYANSITYVTSKKVELADMVLGIHAIIKRGEKNHGKSSYEENHKIVYPEKEDVE